MLSFLTLVVRVRFLANVDPVDFTLSMSGLDPEETLIVVVSKTFTTAETMLNARTAREWLLKGMGGKGGGDDVVLSKQVRSEATER